VWGGERASPDNDSSDVLLDCDVAWRLQVNLGNSRGYRPTLPLKNYDVKLLKVRASWLRGHGGIVFFI
jgi:hypothetical protein